MHRAGHITVYMIYSYSFVLCYGMEKPINLFEHLKIYHSHDAQSINKRS